MFEEIRDLIVEELDIDAAKIKPESTIEELEVDSLDFFQIISEIEDKYDVSFEDEGNLKTIQDLVSYVENNK